MKANCWMGKQHVQLRDVPDPTIVHPQDIIVRVTSSAICGSDLHLYNGLVPTMESGDILGHEFMGEVVETGHDVKTLRKGDRVVVPFPVACGTCSACTRQLYALCETSNPNAWMAQKLWGEAPAGLFGYSHMLGGFSGGQAEYVRVPFADVGPLKVPEGLTDEQVLFLSDIFPTGYMGADMCRITPGQTVAVWGAGPVGQFAIAGAKMLGAGRIIAIDRFAYRLRMAQEHAGATDIINYEEQDVLSALADLTDGRGPDACIDAVGMEAHGHGPSYVYAPDRHNDRTLLERPLALQQAIVSCRSGGTVAVIGVYGGHIDKFPMGALVNRSLTIKAGQCHVHKYMRPLLARIGHGDIDPSFVITHRLRLSDAPQGYEMFMHKEEGCEKIVLSL
ncbi:zinc-dependent alcohol dehydrogenase [Novosphingobium sp.]|uniref:zinc-dependent alcohol dehydrogenase n=1 Tax=Novosphingobium sp. TaxID=1874826 RepID=UPI003D1070FF